MWNFDFNLNFNNIWASIILKLNQSFNTYTLTHLFSEHKYFFVFLFLIYLGMILDKSFSFSSKIFILFYFIFLVAVLLSFRGNFLIQEIFWYTLLLNGSFIFHVCLCDWFYSLFSCWGWDYGAFIITSISFVFSLSFLLYLSDLLYMKLHYYLAKLPSYTTLPYHSNLPLDYDPNSSESSWALFNHCLNIIYYGWSLILLFFMSVFINYVLFLQGIISYNFSLNNFLSFLCYFFLTLVISWGILGVPRLYFIWFMLMFTYVYKYWSNYRYSIKFTFSHMVYDLRWDGEFLIKHDLDSKFDLVYSKGFNYGFIYFLNFALNMTDPYGPEYHLSCPFVYYSRESLILTSLSSSFKYIISEENSMSPEYLELVLDSVFQDLNHLDFQSSEKNFWIQSLKKIYSKSLVTKDGFK